jgi:hypothetical protein
MSNFFEQVIKLCNENTLITKNMWNELNIQNPHKNGLNRREFDNNIASYSGKTNLIKIDVIHILLYYKQYGSVFEWIEAGGDFNQLKSPGGLNWGWAIAKSCGHPLNPWNNSNYYNYDYSSEIKNYNTNKTMINENLNNFLKILINKYPINLIEENTTIIDCIFEKNTIDYIYDIDLLNTIYKKNKNIFFHDENKPKLGLLEISICLLNNKLYKFFLELGIKNKKNIDNNEIIKFSKKLINIITYKISLDSPQEIDLTFYFLKKTIENGFNLIQCKQQILNEFNISWIRNHRYTLDKLNELFIYNEKLCIEKEINTKTDFFIKKKVKI